MSYAAHKIVVRDGKVYIVARYNMGDVPREQFLFYPTTIEPRTMRAYGIESGEPCEPDGRASGLYRLMNHRSPGGEYLTVSLTAGGSTTAEHVEEGEIPAPKVRRGVELRYKNGRWEKLLKREGWVPA